MKTYSVKEKEIQRDWLLVDATDKTLGRLATQVAARLRGKHKPNWCPHLDVGDFIIVVNAEKVRLTGRKWDQKMYHHHSGYPGGIRSFTAKAVLQRKPEELIRLAVRGMLPKNSLGRKQLRKLKVYVGAEHPHSAQQPQTWEVEA